jgi:hydrogenase-4 component F
MIPGEYLLPLMVLLPAVWAVLSLTLRAPGRLLAACVGGTLATAAVAAYGVVRVFTDGPVFAAGHWLMLDRLSAYHVFVMMTVFTLGALYSVIYFTEELHRAHMDRRTLRRYVALWFGTQAAMLLVLVSNNLGVMWVGIEATTLLTAFLICVHATPGALEAMWKYLLMCSVGVAVAFMGILLVAASAAPAQIPGTETLLWSRLMQEAGRLDPGLLKAGFIFMVIGYGTKAGLAPMHNWLPDAHSQAPAPVSAIFSGFLLNAALYCILRCLPLVELAGGHTGWAQGILVAFGLVSILVAAVFFVAQQDVKRLLAYSSVEHIGVMALGIGLGGLGTVAALFHMFNHSLCKVTLFSCAGRLGQTFETHDMRKMTGVLKVSPVWGAGLVGGMLALVGTAPFALFLSEFLILKAAVDQKQFGCGALLLLGLFVVFAGAIRQLMGLAWKEPPAEAKPIPVRWGDACLVLLPLGALLFLCLWIPVPFWKAINGAARVLGGLP